jgi:MULE transposase domain
MLTRARQMLGMGRPGEVSDLLEWFKQTDRSRPGGSFNFRCDDTSTCDALFFMSSEMKESFHRYGQFIVVDATCKTNRFGLQLVLLVGNNQITRTVIFGMALLAREDIPSYQWTLRQVRKAVGQHSMIIRIVLWILVFKLMYVLL